MRYSSRSFPPAARCGRKTAASPARATSVTGAASISSVCRTALRSASTMPPSLPDRCSKSPRTADGTPILMLIDSSSQRMSRRDELLGLNEYLAHLAKTLLLAEHAGHRTIGLLYGGSAAGAFIATALATGTLVALPGAHPEVMDLPSMARVTKLSIDLLREKAKATPVFAPGLDNLARMGAVHEIWDPERPLATQLEALLARPAGDDWRDVLGQQRNGRPKAAAIAARVAQWAQSDA